MALPSLLDAPWSVHTTRMGVSDSRTTLVNRYATGEAALKALKKEARGARTGEVFSIIFVPPEMVKKLATMPKRVSKRVSKKPATKRAPKKRASKKPAAKKAR